MCSDLPGRFISFERVVNFRDLGGYRTADGRKVRWRLLFRSGALNNMTATDTERARQLGIRNVLDLRRVDEIRAGVGPLMTPPVRHHALPLLPEDGSIQLNERFGQRISAERYFAYLGFGAKPFIDILELLAQQETYPAVFHCSAGKDRTGVVAALILDILGVDTGTIVEDYALSSRAADSLLLLWRRLFAERKEQGLLPKDAQFQQLPADYLASPPEAIRDFLERVRSEFGSSRGYFEAQGVQPTMFERLQAALLE